MPEPSLRIVRSRRPFFTHPVVDGHIGPADTHPDHLIVGEAV